VDHSQRQESGCLAEPKRQVCEEATKMSNAKCQEESGVIFPANERKIYYV
jgi:hypothetical protein